MRCVTGKPSYASQPSPAFAHLVTPGRFHSFGSSFEGTWPPEWLKSRFNCRSSRILNCWYNSRCPAKRFPLEKLRLSQWRSSHFESELLSIPSVTVFILSIGILATPLIYRFNVLLEIVSILLQISFLSFYPPVFIHFVVGSCFWREKGFRQACFRYFCRW